MSMHRYSGLTVSRHVEFVTLPNSQKHFGLSPSDVKSTAEVDLSFNPGRTDTKGCIMEITYVPANLAYEVAKVWHSIDRTWDTSILAPEHVVRAGQAKDRFDVFVFSMITSRPTVTQSLPGGVPRYRDMSKQAKKVEALRRMENENLGAWR